MSRRPTTCTSLPCRTERTPCPLRRCFRGMRPSRRQPSSTKRRLDTTPTRRCARARDPITRRRWRRATRAGWNGERRRVRCTVGGEHFRSKLSVLLGVSAGPLRARFGFAGGGGTCSAMGSRARGRRRRLRRRHLADRYRVMRWDRACRSPWIRGSSASVRLSGEQSPKRSAATRRRRLGRGAA